MQSSYIMLKLITENYCIFYQTGTERYSLLHLTVGLKWKIKFLRHV